MVSIKIFWDIANALYPSIGRLPFNCALVVTLGDCHSTLWLLLMIACISVVVIIYLESRSFSLMKLLLCLLG